MLRSSLLAFWYYKITTINYYLKSWWLIDTYRFRKSFILICKCLNFSLEHSNLVGVQFDKIRRWCIDLNIKKMMKQTESWLNEKFDLKISTFCAMHASSILKNTFFTRSEPASLLRSFPILLVWISNWGNCGMFNSKSLSFDAMIWNRICFTCYLHLMICKRILPQRFLCMRIDWLTTRPNWTDLEWATFSTAEGNWMK